MKKVIELKVEIDIPEQIKVQDWFDVFKQHMIKLTEGDLVVTDLVEIKEIDNGNS